MRAVLTVIVVHILAGCASQPEGPQMCALQALGQSVQGFLIVRMACRPEGEAV